MKNSGLCATVTVIASILPALAPKPACTEIFRAAYEGRGTYLVVEVLDDDLIHFEYGAGPAPRADRPIETTVMVCGPEETAPPAARCALFTGPASIHDDLGGTLETDELRLEIDPGDLSISVIDRAKGGIRLTTISPPDFRQPSARLSFARGAELDIYGLGQQFVEPGASDIDWETRVREGGPYGNIMAGFDGGATGNTQIPVVYAVSGASYENYAVFIDTARRVRWDFTGRVSWTVSIVDEVVRFYVMAGPDLLDLRMDFMELAGRPPVPPRQMFGLWLSEFGFDDWYEVGERRRTLHERSFPLDGFVLDLQWFGGIPAVTGSCRMGSLDFDTARFFTPAEIIRGYRERFGIGFMLIEEPYVCERLPEHRVLKERGFLARDSDFETEPAYLRGFWGEGGIIDYTNEECCTFVHDMKRRRLIEAGVMGHWTDLGEPEVYDPASRYAAGNHADAHNLYNLLWVRGIHRGYVRGGAARRPFMLSRSGTAGIQRYGAAMWSGDIASRLTSLAAHAGSQMHLSLSGIDYYGADIGGFHRNLQGDEDEMYTQWYAYGMMFDVPARPHLENLCNCKSNAPDRIGHLESNLANTRRRYELIPYLYSLAHRAFRSGEPLMPPPVVYYQTENAVRSMGRQKMIGRDLMAAVIAGHGATQHDVYLPRGTWYDWHSGERIMSAGEWIRGIPLYRNNLFTLPLYAREGSLVPLSFVDERTQNALGKRIGGEPRTELIVRAFAFARTDTPRVHSFTLYEDDGESVDYQRGAVRETILTQEGGAETIIVIVGEARGAYAGSPELRRTVIQLVGAPSIGGVALNGESLERFSDRAEFESSDAGWYESPGKVTAKSIAMHVSREKCFVFAPTDNR